MENETSVCLVDRSGKVGVPRLCVTKQHHWSLESSGFRESNQIARTADVVLPALSPTGAKFFCHVLTGVQNEICPALNPIWTMIFFLSVRFSWKFCLPACITTPFSVFLVSFPSSRTVPKSYQLPPASNHNINAFANTLKSECFSTSVSIICCSYLVSSFCVTQLLTASTTSTICLGAKTTSIWANGISSTTQRLLIPLIFNMTLEIFDSRPMFLFLPHELNSPTTFPLIRFWG